MGLARSIGKLFSLFGRRTSLSPNPGSDDRISVGREGERLAARFLKRHRYKILYRNFRAPHGGEVDLVCRDRTCDTLVFVEVKTRRSLTYGLPAEAVTRAKQKLIARGAMAWLEMLDNPEMISRFDIVEIVITDGKVEYNLIRDAFTLPAY
jgi:putative endonuclease